MKTMRPKQRKSVTELYGGNALNKSTGNTTAKTHRNGGGDMGTFIMTNTSPYQNIGVAAAPNTTSRRKHTTRHSGTKDIKNLEDMQKKEQSNKLKTSRNADKHGCQDAPPIYDYMNFSEASQGEKQHMLHIQQMQQMQMQPQPTPVRRQATPDSDKDDDTEEFFALIRQTVEGAIGKAMNEILNNNFRELSNKVDRFSAELKATNAMLGKMQCDINNKVVHYGEENSRHFRYLCMKSEYDKMFYQHSSMMAAGKIQPPPPPPPKLRCGPEKRQSKTKGNIGEGSSKAPCTCRSSKKKSESLKAGSDERINPSQKSSEAGVREVLEHIQRFCNSMQFNEMKNEERQKNSRMDEALQMNKDIFENDDDYEDEDLLSSDGMTPRSDDNSVPMRKYSGSMTKRGLSPARGGNGDGDA